MRPTPAIARAPSRAHGERPTEQSIGALSSVRTMVTFDAPGTYRFICHLPGHEAYGMVGVVPSRAADATKGLLTRECLFRH